VSRVSFKQLTVSPAEQSLAVESLRGCEFTLSVHLLGSKGFWAPDNLLLEAKFVYTLSTREPPAASAAS
jgi:hypothetical protein